MTRQFRPTFRLEKLEGDAAFMVAPLEGLTGEALLAAIDATTAAFQARLRSMAQATTCTCEACRRIAELDLKFVVPRGFGRPSARGGPDGARRDGCHRGPPPSEGRSPAAIGLVRYALLSQMRSWRPSGSNVPALGLRAWVERFDFLGDITVHLLDLAARFVTDQPAWTPPRRRPLLEAELQVPLGQVVLCWEELTAPANGRGGRACRASRRSAETPGGASGR